MVKVIKVSTVLKNRLIALSRSYPAFSIYSFILTLLIAFPFTKWNGRDNNKARQCIANLAPQDQVLNADFVDYVENLDIKKHIQEKEIDMTDEENIKAARLHLYERMNIFSTYNDILQRCNVKEFEWKGDHVGLVVPSSALISEKYLGHVVMGLLSASILFMLAFVQRLFIYLSWRFKE